MLGFQFVQRLLPRALCFLDLALSFHGIGPRHRHLGVDLRDLAPRGLHRGFLLGAVQPEDRRSLGDLTGKANVNFGDAPVRLREDRDGSEEQGDVRG